jgi:hypothetical protein
MTRSKTSSGGTYTAADVAASIAKLDQMNSRLDAFVPHKEKQTSWPRLKPDVSVPRRGGEPDTGRMNLQPSHRPSRPSRSIPSTVSSSPEKSFSASSNIDTQRQPSPSFNPQERFDRLRREWRADTTKAHDYPHICGGGGFGDDVDAAFEACSNAPY